MRGLRLDSRFVDRTLNVGPSPPALSPGYRERGAPWLNSPPATSTSSTRSAAATARAGPRWWSATRAGCWRSRGRLRQPADAEDIVQDTFFHFLKGLPAFREDASVETYLFTILRRKLVDHFRGRHMRLCSLQDVLDSGAAAAGGGSSSGGDEAREAASRIAGDDPTPSFYARRDEQAGLDRWRGGRAALAARPAQGGRQPPRPPRDRVPVLRPAPQQGRRRDRRHRREARRPHQAPGA